MQAKQAASLSNKQLVLIGGGHSHLSVIKSLGSNLPNGISIKVISKDRHTPYSGMLPGLIAGHYRSEEAHIDLQQLCSRYGVEFIHDEVRAIHHDNQSITAARSQEYQYDWLSINVGSRPALSTILGASSCGIAVKPIAQFLTHWQQFCEQLSSSDTEVPQPRNIAVVGGGASAVEVTLACQYALQQQVGDGAKNVTFDLFSAGEELLPSYPKKVQRTMERLLSRRQIALHRNHTVRAVQPEHNQYTLEYTNRKNHSCDLVIWAIQAGSPDWVKQTGLACDPQGFITVNPYLQSISHPKVFAAGDIADFCEQALPKSGVYAVREGEVLSENLRRIISGKALKTYQPQRHFLSMITTGDKRAIASKRGFSVAGSWVWRWKNWIDQRFMRRYQA